MRSAIELIPHRSPLLLVDRVRLTANGSVTAERRVTADDPLYDGGLPELLVVEALAQTAASLMGQSIGAHRGALVGLRDFEFHGRASAGETLTLVATKQTTLGTLHRFGAEARVAERLIARGELTLSVEA
jgi:3-hydroxymyristoyl/3-hydroxydecanoyl-(acyl carrier protein) dehydratase